MAWDAKIRPVGRPKISQDSALGFQRLARRFVVEGPKVTKDGLDGTLDGTALIRPIGEPDEEYTDHYLVDQRIEPSTSMNKAYLVREFAKIRYTWAKETISESGDLKKLQRTYVALRNDNTSLATMSVPALGYDTAQFDLLPVSGKVSPDGNDLWDRLPKVIQDTEPGAVSYADEVDPPAVEAGGGSPDPTTRVLWARMVTVTEETEDGSNVKLKITGVIPYRIGTQPFGAVTELEAGSSSVVLGSSFIVLVDPRVSPTASKDILSSFSLYDEALYSTHAATGDARSANNAFNALDVDETSALMAASTITPVQSSFASSKALYGDFANLTLNDSSQTVEFLESFVDSAMDDAPIKWLRASAGLDTSNPGLDVWNVSWAAPVTPFWRTGGVKSKGSKGPSIISFSHHGLKVLRPQAQASGGSATFTWYVVGEQVPLNVSSLASSEPSVSMDFHLVRVEGGSGRTMSFKQTFANAVWPIDTRDGLYFPNAITIEDDPDLYAFFKSIVDTETKVATKMFNSLVFIYRDPSLNVSFLERPLYQMQPLQSTGGHISWNNNYNAAGSHNTHFSITPVFSHNLDRIWRIEATFT